MALRVGDRVVIHSLVTSKGLNWRGGRVVRLFEGEERVGVRVGKQRQVSVRRACLVRIETSAEAAHAALLKATLLDARMRTVMQLLEVLLPDVSARTRTGVTVSAYCGFRREAILSFGGFANGHVVPDYVRYTPDGRRKRFSQEAAPRFDCAAAAIDETRILIAGGCTAHPGLAKEQRTAAVYDSILGEWSSLPNMHFARHGARGVMLNGKFYAVGGAYARPGSEPFLSFTECFDGVCWKSLPRSAYPSDMHASVLKDVAFAPCAVVKGELYVLLPSIALVFDGTSWRSKRRGPKLLPASCLTTAVLGNAIILLSGRPASSSLRTWALNPDTLQYFVLPDLPRACVFASAVVMNASTLIVSGGVCDETDQFFDDALRLDLRMPPHEVKTASAEDIARVAAGWTILPYFRMPNPLHCHSAVVVPDIAETGC